MKYGLVLLLAMAVVAFIPACSTTSEESDAGPGDGGAGDAGIKPAYDWPKCDSVSAGTSLAEKAVYFDGVAAGMHLAPDGLFRNLWLTEDLTQIDHWTHVENVILWSGIYLASQAFRYAVTKNPEAVENARKVLVGLHDLTGVTGSRGL